MHQCARHRAKHHDLIAVHGAAGDGRAHVKQLGAGGIAHRKLAVAQIQGRQPGQNGRRLRPLQRHNRPSIALIAERRMGAQTVAWRATNQHRMAMAKPLQLATLPLNHLARARP